MNKLDHVLPIKEHMVCTYQHKKPLRYTRSQLLAAVTVKSDKMTAALASRKFNVPVTINPSGSRERKGGQSGVVKIPSCKLLYIIQVKGSSWPVSKVLVAYNHSYNAASDWPHTFLQPGCFCLGLLQQVAIL